MSSSSLAYFYIIILSIAHMLQDYSLQHYYNIIYKYGPFQRTPIVII